MLEDNSDIDILAIGEEEVEKVKELGIDRARKVKKGDEFCYSILMVDNAAIGNLK